MNEGYQALWGVIWDYYADFQPCLLLRNFPVVTADSMMYVQSESSQTDQQTDRQADKFTEK